MSNKNIHLYLADLIMDVIPPTMQSIREEMRKGRGERLTVPQFRVLAAVKRGISHNKDIGELLGVSEAAISRMIDYLVQDGLIKKGTNKEDRRQKNLSLTSEGETLYASIKAEARLAFKDKLENLSKEDTQIIVKGFETLKDNFVF